MKFLVALSVFLAAASAVPSYMRMDAKVRYPHLMLDPAEGFEKKFRNSRIHDGEDAEPGQFPFIVAVEMPLNSLGTSFYFCGGSILSETTVVTAAHCVLDAVPEYGITVVFGTINWNTAPDSNKFYGLDEYDAHPDFTFNNFGPITSDIAYVKVPGFQFDDLTAPITIAKEEPVPGDHCTEIGWGATCNFCSISDTLQYAEGIEVLTDEEVDAFYGGSGDPNGDPNDHVFVYEEFVCTEGRSSVDTGAGTCGGDSGGPAIDEGGFLFGATSFGSTTCEQGENCFSSVVYWKPWLEENTGEVFP